MSKTIVRCSMPECEKEAVSKVAAPWHYGALAELKTYGYTCATHTDSVVASAKKRFISSHLAPEESVGEIDIVALPER